MTLALNRPDASTVKARQQKTWSSGDFTVVAARIVLVSELLADNAGPPGWRVLDVACGNGNATLAAARSGAHVVGVDYVPELVEDGRARAVTEGLDVEFRVGDAEDLPAGDASFDAVLSVFGSMFAPDHQRTADEIVQVARPGAHP
jgi:ubiquinone/menaquinone biosynthesis C-methylase UbiE